MVWSLRVGLAQVAHVHVPRGKVQSCEELTSADIERQFGGDGAPAEQGGSRMHQAAAAGLELLQQLLRAVGQQPPGRYLLCRAPRDTTCCLFRALPPDLEASVQASYCRSLLPPPVALHSVLVQHSAVLALCAASPPCSCYMVLLACPTAAIIHPLFSAGSGLTTSLQLDGGT